MERINFNDIVVQFRNEKEKTTGKKVKDEKNFYDQEVKYFNDILTMLDIWNERKYMKKDFDDLKEYSFYEEDVGFVKGLLFKYTGKEFQNMRRNKFHTVHYTFLEEIIDGFKNVLLHNEVPEGVINNVIMKMYNRTNYPLNKQINSFKQPLEDLIKFADEMFYPKSLIYLTQQDKLEILATIQKEIRELVIMWKDIYRLFDEFRNDEINEIAFEEAKNMTIQEENNALLDMNVTLNIFSLLENNEEYKMLCAEKEKLIQNDEFIQKKVKKFDKITERILEMYDEAQKEFKDGKILIDFRNEKHMSHFGSMKPSKEVLTTVLKERQENIEAMEEWEKKRQQMIELLKEVDIEEIINNIENTGSLGNSK